MQAPLCTQSKTCLSNHAIPNAINFLPMFPIGHQVEVIGEANNLGKSLEDVNAETLAALLQRSHTFMNSTGKEKVKKQKMTKKKWVTENTYWGKDLSDRFDDLV